MSFCHSNHPSLHSISIAAVILFIRTRCFFLHVSTTRNIDGLVSNQYNIFSVSQLRFMYTSTDFYHYQAINSCRAQEYVYPSVESGACYFVKGLTKFLTLFLTLWRKEAGKIRCCSVVEKRDEHSFWLDIPSESKQSLTTRWRNTEYSCRLSQREMLCIQHSGTDMKSVFVEFPPHCTLT